MNTLRKVSVACLQYELKPISTFSDFKSQVTRMAETSANNGSHLMVFPEYFSLQLLSLQSDTSNLHSSLATVAKSRPEFQDLFLNLARKTKNYIVSGTMPGFDKATGTLTNESHIFTPNGNMGTQPKLQMTRFEREQWDVRSGQGLRIFETKLGRLAICTCYDIEFPEIARTAASAGATILIVPSCTSKRSGFMRVRVCSQARAIENQLYVLHAPLVGSLPKIPDVDTMYGRAGIFAPSDEGFPLDGLVAESLVNQEDIVSAVLDMEALKKCRENGQVFLFRDAPKTSALLVGSQTVDLE